ncbi:hypothetical protein RBSWK_03031 [Rhodopirellula baltica SWK14]|uniref:Uncharacterized protein n=1 Tax=Rhodopirellula baltica SWK14 TaxID=993516 RepID=L7CH59_RHOBT|nr:hypothetical protein RBSWK_03031 [Rhodopirellula baltica SWK14]
MDCKKTCAKRRRNRRSTSRTGPTTGQSFQSAQSEDNLSRVHSVGGVASITLAIVAGYSQP